MKSQNQDKIRILAVDDEEEILKMYQHILGTSDNKDAFAEISNKAKELFGNRSPEEHKTLFDLVTCLQGDEAVTQVEQSLEDGNPFAVAFVDIRMPPGPSGDWVARRIHELDPCMNIVIVTAYSDVSPKEISSSFQVPARLFYIQKPFHWDEIYQFATALSNNWEIQNELKEHHEMLEGHLEDQASKLYNAQQNAQDMLIGKIQYEEELEQKTEQIEEVNIALRVLLREKETDRARTEENIGFNINEYVLPYIQKLRDLSLTEQQEQLVTIIENNLRDVTSSFSSREAPKHHKFSPMELQVAQFIKHGSTSKEIANALNLSTLTVESYRRNIRKKVGLTKSKENLRIWLLNNL